MLCAGPQKVWSGADVPQMLVQVHRLKMLGSRRLSRNEQTSCLRARSETRQCSGPRMWLDGNLGFSTVRDRHISYMKRRQVFGEKTEARRHGGGASLVFPHLNDLRPTNPRMVGGVFSKKTFTTHIYRFNITAQSNVRSNVQSILCLTSLCEFHCVGYI